MKKRFLALSVIVLLLLSSCARFSPVTKDEQRIVSIAPNATEILIGLGLEENIVACDSYSLPLLKNEVPTVDSADITKPNMEAIVSANPTLVITTEINRVEGDNPFSLLTETGVKVEYLPTAQTIDDIAASIKVIGDAAGKSKEAETLSKNMLAEIAEIKDITAKADKQKTVYFEIGADPQLYSFGSGTFLNELLTACNVKNIFDDNEGWISPSAESILDRNPDVILTNIGYIDGIIDIIKTRDGFAEINAVKNGEIYLIDPDSSARPSQNIVKAVRQIAEVVYPELFQ